MSKVACKNGGWQQLASDHLLKLDMEHVAATDTRQVVVESVWRKQQVSNLLLVSI